ncbi:maleylpyruvate isomerase family mycothiol-dependent enzyme [Kitasatospora sp. NPDC006697]|uniref:maleylpyruvate isomerase family mycothiol-dependent enzyme n=1 Tax=Kitasatospora sp. NPDC006697 TaxID=3364020 RepID=UPI0036A20604
MDYLVALRRELDLLGAALDGDLTAPVEHCGSWTVADLAVHVGAGNLWVVTAVREKHGRDYDEGAAPRDPAALRAWFAGSSEALIEALSVDPDTEAWTFAVPHTVAFWHRRRAQETLVHRWDAEHALGAVTPFDPELAADGVAEVFEIMAPRMISRGAATAPARAVRITATDAASSWTFGPGEPVAELRGTAQDLLLTLWGRLPREAGSLSWTGDREAGLAALAGPLVP